MVKITKIKYKHNKENHQQKYTLTQEMMNIKLNTRQINKKQI